MIVSALLKTWVIILRAYFRDVGVYVTYKICDFQWDTEICRKLLNYESFKNIIGLISQEKEGSEFLGSISSKRHNSVRFLLNQYGYALERLIYQGRNLKLAFQGLRITIIDLVEIVFLSFPIFRICARVRKWLDTPLSIFIFGKSTKRFCLLF